MPKPKKGESRNEYVSRCISYVTHKEGATHAQAVGKCMGMANQKYGDPRKKGKD